MKNAILLLSFLSLIGGFYISCTNTSNDSAPSQQTTTYTCPMHPEVQSDSPGTCPICDMDLVPKKERKHQPPKDQQLEAKGRSAPATHGDVTINPRQQQLIGIKTTAAQKRNLSKVIEAPGRVAFDPKLYTAQREYIEALKQWEKVKNSPLEDVKRSTKEMIRSSKVRLKVLGLSDQQIAKLTPNSPGNEGLLLGKSNDSWIYANVFENDLPFIQPGLSVELSAPYLNNPLSGKVVAVDNIINPKTRTAKVRIQRDKSDVDLRPQSYVNVTIFSPLGKKLAVPEEAVMDTGKKKIVFVDQGEGHFKPQVVEPLITANGFTAIKSGLQEGQKVVVDGNFMLDSESRLKGVMKK